MALPIPFPNLAVTIPVTDPASQQIVGYVVRMWNPARPDNVVSMIFDYSKGQPSVRLVPGIGTLEIPSAPPRLNASPLGQSVPKGAGMAIGNIATLALIIVDLRIALAQYENRKEAEAKVQKELHELALKMMEMSNEMGVEPLTQTRLAHKHTRKRKKQSTGKRYRIYGYSRRITGRRS